jgi:hypothetical protein
VITTAVPVILCFFSEVGVGLIFPYGKFSRKFSAVFFQKIFRTGKLDPPQLQKKNKEYPALLWLSLTLHIIEVTSYNMCLVPIVELEIFRALHNFLLMCARTVLKYEPYQLSSVLHI